LKFAKGKIAQKKINPIIFCAILIGGAESFCASPMAHSKRKNPSAEIKRKEGAPGDLPPEKKKWGLGETSPGEKKEGFQGRSPPLRRVWGDHSPKNSFFMEIIL